MPRRASTPRTAIQNPKSKIQNPLLRVKEMHFPLDRSYYCEKGAHIWVKKVRGGVALGLDDFVAKNAGELTFLNIEGKRVNAGGPFGTYESAKFVSHMISPVSGTIHKVNRRAVSRPALVNRAPYRNWLVLVRPDGNGPSRPLIADRAALKERLEEEIKEDSA